MDRDAPFNRPVGAGSFREWNSRSNLKFVTESVREDVRRACSSSGSRGLDLRGCRLPPRLPGADRHPDSNPPPTSMSWRRPPSSSSGRDASSRAINVEDLPHELKPLARSRPKPRAPSPVRRPSPGPGRAPYSSSSHRQMAPAMREQAAESKRVLQEKAERARERQQQQQEKEKERKRNMEEQQRAAAARIQLECVESLSPATEGTGLARAAKRPRFTPPTKPTSARP